MGVTAGTSGYPTPQITGSITALPGVIEGFVTQTKAADDWVKETERKPPDNKTVEVLVLWNTRLAKWFHGEWVGQNGDRIHHVSHWRFTKTWAI